MPLEGHEEYLRCYLPIRYLQDLFLSREKRRVKRRETEGSANQLYVPRLKSKIPREIEGGTNFDSGFSWDSTQTVLPFSGKKPTFAETSMLRWFLLGNRWINVVK